MGLCLAEINLTHCQYTIQTLAECSFSTPFYNLLSVSSFSPLMCTTRWRDVVAVRRQLKRQMRGFPAAPCCVDPRFKLKALAPSAPAQPCIADLARGLVNLGNAGTLALSSTRYVHCRFPSVFLDIIANPF